MDHKTNIHELKDKVKKFCDERDWDQHHNPKDLAIAITLEAAELLELFRYKSNKEMEDLFNDEAKRQEIAEEAADILHMLLRFSQKYGIDLTTELGKKMDKNEKKYPVDKCKGSNKKYTEL